MKKPILTAMAASAVASFSVRGEVLDSLSEYGNAATANATSGAGTPRGFTNPAADQYTITAGGTDFWSNSDHGSFIYDADQVQSGDFSAIVRSVSVAGDPAEILAGEWGRTGVMARATDPTAANAAYAAHTRKSGGGNPTTVLQWRDTINAGTARVEHGNGAANIANGSVRDTPIWLALHRYDGVWYSSWAPDVAGAPGAWSGTLAHPTTGDNNGDVYVGLAHQSHNINPEVNTAVFEAFSVGTFDNALGDFPGEIGGSLLLGDGNILNGTITSDEIGPGGDPTPVDRWTIAVEGESWVPGLRADIYFNGNPGNLADIQAVIDSRKPDGIANIANPHWSGPAAPFGYPAEFTAATGQFTGNQENFFVDHTGEIWIPGDGDRDPGPDGNIDTVAFKDGVDDYTYLNIDGQALVDDNGWTSADGSANGGSPIVQLDVSDPKYDDGEWVSFRFIAAEGGGGDAGMLYTDVNDTNDNFPVANGDVANVDDLVPDNFFRTHTSTYFGSGDQTSGGPLLFVKDVTDADDATAPGDPVVPSSASHPAGEAAPLAIDNDPNTKYLNFDEVNTGFEVTPSGGASVVIGLRLTSANDTPGRDPATYELEGSNDGGTTWDPIASGAVPAFTARFQQRLITFANAADYTSYRLIFPTVASPGVGSMQIAEVEFLTALPVECPIELPVGDNLVTLCVNGQLAASETITVNPAEIAAYDGPTTGDPEITSGQAAPVDFGVHPGGAVVTRDFTVANWDDYPLELMEPVMPAGYSLVGPSPFPASVIEGDSMTFTVQMDTSTDAVLSGDISIAHNDPDDMENPFLIPVTGIADLTPPVITTPPTVRETAPPGETSVAVFYDASAADNHDPEPTLVCVPESGSVFDWGTTVVTCTATDWVGNESVATFLVCVSLPGDVLVLGPATGEAAPGEAGGGGGGGPSAGTITSIVGAHLAGAGKLLVEADADSVRGLWAGDVGALGQVALTGSTTAADGAVLSGIDRYSISEWGDVTLRGRDAIGDAGNWLGDAGSAVAGIGFVGEAAPDTAGSFSEVSLGGWALNNTGEQFALAFIGKDPGLGIDDSNNSGIWSSDDGLVLREGDPVAAVPGGTHGKFGNQIAANDAGWLAFDSAIVGVGGANRGVFSGPAANPGLVARRDDPAPGIPGATLERFLGVAQNAAGEVAFPAQVIGAVTPHDNDGLWTNAGGPLQLVAREGDEVPGSEGTLLFDSFFDIYVTDAVDGELFGAVNAVIFAAQLRGADIALSASEDTAFFAYIPQLDLLAPIAFEGDIAPGTSGVFRSLTALNVHDGGDLAFNGILVRGVGGVTRADDHGVWCASPDSEVALLIRSGETFVDATETEQTIRRVFISDTHDNGTAGRSGPVSCGNVAVIATYLNNRASSVLVLGKPGAPQEGGGEIVVTQDGGS